MGPRVATDGTSIGSNDAATQSEDTQPAPVFTTAMRSDPRGPTADKMTSGTLCGGESGQVKSGWMSHSRQARKPLSVIAVLRHTNDHDSRPL